MPPDAGLRFSKCTTLSVLTEICVLTMAKLPGARSTNGCWTCRLRRKKCDETHPNCEVCGKLNLECHGYGPRPDWMDRGILEKEAAEKIKSRIARPRRRRTSAAIDQSPRDLSTSDLGALVQCSDLSSPTTEASIIAVPTPAMSHSFNIDFDDIGNLADFQRCQGLSPSLLDTTGLFYAEYLPDFGSERGKETTLTPISEDQALQLVAHSRPATSSSTGSSLPSDQEACLLGRYVGHLIFAQFPSAQAPTSEREHDPFWLHTLLFSSVSVRTATCRLMRSYLGILDGVMRPESEMQDMEPADSPHAILSILDAKNRQQSIIEICTSKLQAIFTEVWVICLMTGALGLILASSNQPCRSSVLEHRLGRPF